MVTKADGVKPDSGYDFGEDWLNEIEDVFDFETDSDSSVVNSTQSNPAPIVDLKAPPKATTVKNATAAKGIGLPAKNGINLDKNAMPKVHAPSTTMPAAKPAPVVHAPSTTMPAVKTAPIVHAPSTTMPAAKPAPVVHAPSTTMPAAKPAPIVHAPSTTMPAAKTQAASSVGGPRKSVMVNAAIKPAIAPICASPKTQSTDSPEPATQTPDEDAPAKLTLAGFDDDFIESLYGAFDESEDIELDFDVDDVTDTHELDVDLAITPEVYYAVDAGKPVVAQMLNIAALKKEIVLRNEHGISDAKSKCDEDEPLKDPQLWQFVSLIAMRLFDDLELMIVQKNYHEACDVMKQLDRLANLLGFAGLSIYLPVIAYISKFLPLDFTDAEIGEHSARKFNAAKMVDFFENSEEFLNCLVYLLDALANVAPTFDISRFTDSLDSLYKVLNITPAAPSSDAPLAVIDNINPPELTSRTINKLARTLEALVTEALHYIESSVCYGYSKGYADAAKSLSSASQIAREYKLEDIEPLFAKLYLGCKSFVMPKIPPQAFFKDFAEVCRLLELHFSKNISEKKFKQLRTLLAKFAGKGKSQDAPFSARWAEFVKTAAPILDLECVEFRILPDKVKEVAELAKKHGIRWIAETLNKLATLWPTYRMSCAEAFIVLADEIRAFPAQDIEESDIEQLNHERLRVLFNRKIDDPIPEPKTVIEAAQKHAELLISQMEKPENISSEKIHELLIDARRIRCHALTRSYQVILTLLERITRTHDTVIVADSLVDALYFCISFLQTVCSMLKQHIEHDSNSPAVASLHIFYSALLALYQTPGQPRDGVTWFILKRINAIISELQLVWVNTATPTSTEYYCSLMRKLLHLATVCEMAEARRVILQHLDDIPPQDFINTENRSMNRQCGRVIQLMEDTSPKLTVLPSTSQVKLFFTKTIAALNQLLSSRDVNDPQAIRRELFRIDARMSMLGMTTDFPPVIAFIYELHYLSFAIDGDRTRLEDLLFEMINVANNVCPEWVQPKETELEFVKSAVSLPMPFFQEMLESVSIIREALEPKALEEAVAWERINMLHQDLRRIVGYMPYALRLIAQNAQNRCRYLKKNIFIDINTNGYPPEADIPTDAVSPVIAMAFATIVDKLLEAIIDNAFTMTDQCSRISIVLQPFTNEFSASISHNGKLFTVSEMTEKLARVNIMPAVDDNIFDLLVASKRLSVTYPPINAIAYILPILRQFDGRFDVSEDNNGNTCFYLNFKL